MNIQIIERDFSVCKLPDFSQVHHDDPFYCMGKTDSEYSLVCGTEFIPANALVSESGWNAFRVHGTLDFSLIGVLAKISGALAEADISIFAISTFDTDYVMVKQESFVKAINVLAEVGCIVVQ